MATGDVYEGNISHAAVGGHGNTNNIQITYGSSGNRAFDEIARRADNASLDSVENLTCYNGTRVDVLNRLKSWATESSGSPIAWLHGSAGSGKSTILSTIAQMLLKQNALIASYFNGRSNTSQGKTTFFATLAYDLARHIESTRIHMGKAVENNPKVFGQSQQSQARELIVEPLKAANLPSDDVRRVIIVDGLDEYRDAEQQKQILQALSYINTALRESSTPVAILIASRAEQHIREVFDSSDMKANSLRLSLDGEYNADKDIQAYLTGSFRTIIATHPFKKYLPKNWPPKGTISTLVSWASGQFIYASTVVKFISSPRHKPSEQLKIVMDNTSGAKEAFQQLDNLYSTIFRSLDSNPTELRETLHIVGLVLLLSSGMGFASEDASVRQSPAFVAKFLGVEPMKVRQRLLGLESLLTVDEHKDNKGIRIHHASLYDYLIDKSRSGSFSIDARAIEAEIVETLLPPFESIWSRNSIINIDMQLIFYHAEPTKRLYKAIKDCDLSKADCSNRLIRLYYIPDLLRAIRQAEFPNAEQLYQLKLAQYVKLIESSLAVYYQDEALKIALIASVFMPLNDIMMNPTLFVRMFGLEAKAKASDTKETIGFFLARGCDESFRLVMEDILQGSDWYIYGSEFTDTALHLLNCMDEKSPFYVDDKVSRQIDKSDGRDSSGVRSVEACIARGFPKILSKALIRKDLLKRTLDYHISESYLKYPEVTDALKAYQRRASNKKAQPANNGYDTKEGQQYSSYLPDQYSQDEQYLQDDQYAQGDQYAQDGQYGQYLQDGQYDQDAQYASDDQYLPNQQYLSDEQYYSGQQYQAPLSTVDDYSLTQQSAALQQYYPASPHVPRRLRYMAPGQNGYPQGRVLVPVRVYRRVRRCDLDDGRRMAYGHSGF